MPKTLGDLEKENSLTLSEMAEFYELIEVGSWVNKNHLLELIKGNLGLPRG